MSTRSASRATLFCVLNTKIVSENLQKHFLCPRGAQQCCRVLPRTGNIAGHNVAATLCPRFAGPSLPTGSPLGLNSNAREELERVKKRRGGGGGGGEMLASPAPASFITRPSFSARAVFPENEAESLGRACGQASRGLSSAVVRYHGVLPRLRRLTCFYWGVRRNRARGKPGFRQLRSWERAGDDSSSSQTTPYSRYDFPHII